MGFEEIVGQEASRDAEDGIEWPKCTLAKASGVKMKRLAY